ncbi:MAG TPA: FixH family protein [Kofleriaceae bacterium]|nr:FixH family protein [Kofleriaceae bacterium]
MTAKTRWVGIIIGLLVGNVCATSGLIAASQHGASRVIPSYYERALRYDDQLDQAARSAALAWHVELALTPAGIRVVGRDRDGHALRGARVRITAAPRAPGLPGFELALVEVAGGDYRAPLFVAPGWYDATVTVERGDSRFVRAIATEAR